MTISKVNVREGEFIFQISDTNSFTTPLEIFDRFGASKHSINGFFAHITFTAAFTGTIEVHLGPTKDTLVQIPELDMELNAAVTPCTFDIVTRAHYVKLVVISGFAFTGEILIAR